MIELYVIHLMKDVVYLHSYVISIYVYVQAFEPLSSYIFVMPPYRIQLSFMFKHWDILNCIMVKFHCQQHVLEVES